MTRMRASPCVVLDAGLDTRVSLLMDEYRHFLEDRRLLGEQLDCLVALHGREKIAEWKATADGRALVARLLAEHYDPAYRRSSAHNFARLAEARRVPVAAPGEDAFLDAARALLSEAVPA